MIKRLFLLIFVPFVFTAVYADAAPLQPDQAFALSVSSTTTKGINLDWKIAPGYHLYRDKIAVAIDKDATNNAAIGTIDLPPGTPAQDPIQGKYQEYQQQLKLNIPVTAPNQTPVRLLVDYQGCAEGSICYPPVTKEIKFNLSNNSPVVILNHDLVTIPAIQSQSLAVSTPRFLSYFMAGQPMRKVFLDGAVVLVLLMLIQTFVSRTLRATRRLEAE